MLMSIQNRLLKTAVLGLIFTLSCSLPSKTTSSVTDHRDPASFHRASAFCSLDPISGNFTNVITTLQSYGLLNRGEAETLSSLSNTTIAERVTASLPQFYFENDLLVQAFDRQIKNGKTLADLSRPNQGYAKILSARVLWEEINQTLQAYSRDRLMVAKQAVVDSGSDAPDILIQESKAISDFFKRAAAQTTDDAGLVALSLDTLLNYVSESTRFLLSCESADEGVVVAGDVASAADLRKRPLNRVILKKKKFPFGSRFTREAYDVSEKIIQPILDGATHSASALDAVPLYKPDVGVQGNIKGNLFPKGVWSLTYDDGPGANTTPTVLNNLLELKTPATFFVLTQQVERLPNIALRVVKEGHAIASHSYSHARVPGLGPEGMKKELDDAVSALETKTGTPIRFFRLPYGAGVSVSKIRERIAALGLIHVFWNVDTLDWQDKNPDTIYTRALTQMKNLGAGVILFHDIHPQSVIASKRVLQYILDPVNKLRHVTIPEIVDEQNKLPPAPTVTPGA